MIEFSIIHYEDHHFNDVNEFWNATGLGGSHRGDTPAIIRDTLSAGGHLLLMVNSMGEIIGTSWLTNDKRRTYLHHFGIREDLRRQGLARHLLTASFELAKTDGLQVKLEVHRDNLAARQLYKQYGFRELGDYEVLIVRDLSAISNP